MSLTSCIRKTTKTVLYSIQVILGSTVIRAPTSELTPTALLEFGYAIDLFQEALNTSPRAKRAMVLYFKI